LANGRRNGCRISTKDGYTSYKPTTLFRKQKLIFLKENTLAVVEVKTLFFGFGLPQDFVKPKKSSFLLKLLMPCKRKRS
jgi:hypothetical protein